MLCLKPFSVWRFSWIGMVSPLRDMSFSLEEDEKNLKQKRINNKCYKLFEPIQNTSYTRTHIVRFNAKNINCQPGAWIHMSKQSWWRKRKNKKQNTQNQNQNRICIVWLRGCCACFHSFLFLDLNPTSHCFLLFLEYSSAFYFHCGNSSFVIFFFLLITSLAKRSDRTKTKQCQK